MADELMNTNTDELSEETKIKMATSLDFLIQQLSHKEKLLADLDAKILPLINNESELETDLFEMEEIQCKIAETGGNSSHSLVLVYKVTLASLNILSSLDQSYWSHNQH